MESTSTPQTLDQLSSYVRDSPWLSKSTTPRVYENRATVPCDFHFSVLVLFVRKINLLTHFLKGGPRNEFYQVRGSWRKRVGNHSFSKYHNNLLIHAFQFLSSEYTKKRKVWQAEK